jgi:hypothetical protein
MWWLNLWTTLRPDHWKADFSLKYVRKWEHNTNHFYFTVFLVGFQEEILRLMSTICEKSLFPRAVHVCLVLFDCTNWIILLYFVRDDLLYPKCNLKIVWTHSIKWKSHTRSIWTRTSALMILMKIEVRTQVYVKDFSIKCHENPFSKSVKCYMWTDSDEGNWYFATFSSKCAWKMNWQSLLM